MLLYAANYLDHFCHNPALNFLLSKKNAGKLNSLEAAAEFELVFNCYLAMLFAMVKHLQLVVSFTFFFGISLWFHVVFGQCQNIRLKKVAALQLLIAAIYQILHE